MRDERAFNQTKAGEKETLVAFLRFYQDTLLMKLDGLERDRLLRPGVDSGLSLLGLLKHATYVHARWFELCFKDLTPTDLPWPTEDFVVGDEETTDGLTDAYRRHVTLSHEIIAGADLDDANAGWSGGGFEPGKYNLRWIVVHMIEELARHCGHADIIREQLDGTTGV